MAARRKKPVAPAAVDAGAFAVVVETLRGDFKVFGEALAGQAAAIQSLRAEMRDGFASVRAEFHHELVDVRTDLTEVRTGLAEVRTDLADVKVELGLVKSAVLEHGRELREIRDRKVDRDEVEGIVQGVLARAGGR